MARRELVAHLERELVCEACGLAFKQKRVGRPRKLCGEPECDAAMARHRAGAARRAHAAEARAWLVGLPPEQKAKAYAWIHAFKAPKSASMTKTMWAYAHRKEILGD